MPIELLHDAKMLSLVRRTVAKDCNEDEFNIFIAMCRALQLDPLRKQAYAFVFKKKEKKNAKGEVIQEGSRQLTLVTSIAGFRTIADRTGNYRPDEDAGILYFEEAAKDPATNPLGLIKAVICVWKFSHGDWHKVTAEAYWDEYAPIKDEWGEDESGKWRLTGRRSLDTSGQWGKMPRVMLAKVAEAAALRKAFPDELSNVHGDEEIDRQKFLDLTPAEAVEAGNADERMKRIGGSKTIIVDWLGGDMVALDCVPLGQFADRAFAFIESHKDEPSQIILWRNRNRVGLKEFWAQSPGDALELKNKIETAIEAAEAPA